MKEEFIRTVQDREYIFNGLVDEVDPGELFIESSKVHPGLTILGEVHGEVSDPLSPIHYSLSRSAKQYDACPCISLPSAKIPSLSFADVLLTRRTKQKAMVSESLHLEELATLLFAGYGITHAGKQEVGQLFRASPSGGGLYPNDIYLAVKNVEGLSQGLYHYHPFKHRLEILDVCNVETFLGEMSVHKNVSDSCSVMLFFVSSFWRSRFKYGLRAYRFALLDAGHLAQNILLTANALALEAVPVGGYYDQVIDDALHLDGVTESCIYTLAVARRCDEVAP
ncbi:MAG: SagB/ThcOx family dehydrogenase [Trueperaceae bacterium]